MENTDLCIICGVDMLPRTGVFWCRPSENTRELVFSPPFRPRAHRANGMHWCCFDAHRSVLQKCDAGKEPHATADCCHDRAVHSERIEDVRKKPNESWTAYFARCEPSSQWNANSHERLMAIVMFAPENPVDINISR